MNAAVAAIRAREASLGMPTHLVAVQGTRGWARDLSYYVTRPIAASGGKSVVYETHPYNPSADLAALVFEPATSLPVVIGEFGPSAGAMNSSDAAALMRQATAHGVPWIAWSLHMRCDPSMLQDLSGGGCGLGMPLRLTDWVGGWAERGGAGRVERRAGQGGMWLLGSGVWHQRSTSSSCICTESAGQAGQIVSTCVSAPDAASHCLTDCSSRRRPWVCLERYMYVFLPLHCKTPGNLSDCPVWHTHEAAPAWRHSGQGGSAGKSSRQMYPRQHATHIPHRDVKPL